MFNAHDPDSHRLSHGPAQPAARRKTLPSNGSRQRFRERERHIWIYRWELRSGSAVRTGTGTVRAMSAESVEGLAQLTRIGPATPAGELLRRYWFPVAVVSEVGDGPARTRLLGEDLVIFRDRKGAWGALDMACPHRGASLSFGKVVPGGIRCAYHGWSFATDGTCFSQPNLPPGREIGSVGEIAHHAAEQGGLVFVRLRSGRSPVPPVPRFDILVAEGGRRGYYSAIYHCNYLQVLENLSDPLHPSFLHSDVRKEAGAETQSASQLRYDSRVPRRARFVETPQGIKSTIITELGAGKEFLHSINFCMPGLIRSSVSDPHTPGGKEAFAQVSQWVVPIDDTTTNVLFCVHVPEGSPLPEDYLPRWKVVTKHVDDQDKDVLESLGSVVNRRAEHLVSSDDGVRLLRKVLLQQLFDSKEGKPLKGFPPAGDPGATLVFDSDDTIVQT